MKQILKDKLESIAPFIIWEVQSALANSIQLKAWLVVLLNTQPVSTKPLHCTIQLDELEEKYPKGWDKEPALEQVAMTICKSCAIELVSSLIKDTEPEI